MNILHVIETLGVGGAEQLLVTTLPEMRRKGDKVFVAVLRAPLDLLDKLETAGVPVFVLPVRNKWNLLRAAIDISRLARENRCHVIHSHLYFSAVTVALARCLKFTDASTAVSFHNLAYAPGVNRPGVKLWLRKKLAQWLYPCGYDAYVAISDAVASHYASQFSLSEIHVVHNPVDLESIDHLEMNKPRGSMDVIHMVLPGRLVHEKGHNDFLSALVILRKDHHFRVTFAGDGPLRQALETEIRRSHLKDIVTITGFLKHEHMLKVVSGADIVVLPSRYEGFGLTAIEAMALSRPIVATMTGGLMEIVVNSVNGVLVPVGNPQALASELSRLIDDPLLRERMGRAGRKRVERCFSLPVYINKMRGIYKRLYSDDSMKISHDKEAE